MILGFAFRDSLETLQNIFFLQSAVQIAALSGHDLPMQTPDQLLFECFELDFAMRELRKNGDAIKVEPQVFDLLWYLANNAGNLVSKDDLIEHVWNGRIVSDAAISTRINGARVAVEDSGNEQRIIRTIPRRGFRFLAEVSNLLSELAESTEPINKDSLVSADLNDQKPAIAIMPFRAMGEAREISDLAEGIRIDIQNALIKVSGLFLTAVGSVNAVRDMEPLEAAKTINARYLLNGQIRKSQDQLKLSIQLLDAKSNRIVLSDQFTHKLTDTFMVLDEVAAEVLETLNVALIAGEPARIWHKTLRDVESLSVLYRGLSNFFKMNRESLSLARSDFEKIVRLHPNLAIGYTWIALTHWFDLQRGWTDDRDDTRAKAREFAEKATALPDTDGQAHTVLSHVYLLEGKFNKALEAGKQAVANRPSCTNANAFYANVLHYCGHNLEALSHIRLALQQSPLSPNFFKLVLIKILIATDRIDEAKAVFEKIWATSSDDIEVQLLGCLIAVRGDDKIVAAERAKKLLQNEPEFAIEKYLSGEPYQTEELRNKLAADLARSGLPI